MVRRPQPKGTCQFCQKSYAKGGLNRHLKSCRARAAANAAAKGKIERLYQLRVEDAYSGAFWLDLELRSNAMLDDLDHYLRAIWLDCCGHMSEFSDRPWGNQFNMSATAGTTFELYDKVAYQYDFGSTTELVIKRVAIREAVPLSKRPIYLLARNEQPPAPCQVCGEAAGHLCMECVYEDDKTGMLCDKHVADHPHEDYGEPHLLVNSPRVGMCGPIDSAEAPY